MNIDPKLLRPETFRVHGNGFVQVDMLDGGRLHIWDDRIPRQRIPSPIHNHRFGFKSRVIRGTLVNLCIELIPSGKDLRLYRPGKGDRLYDTGETCSVIMTTTQTIGPGQAYSMRPGEWHLSVPVGPTITYMIKTEIDKSIQVGVLCADKPDNEFVRSDAMTWDEVVTLLRTM